MKKEMKISKITDYDKFKCIADKCRFTCCTGWDIAVDTNTYNKWESNGCDYILNNVKIKKGGSERKYFINKKTKDACPLLDKQGLCQIVKKHGEEYLSLTCHSFPRIENIFESKTELSLSCACPEVVEIISNINGKVNMISETENDSENNLLRLKIRKTLVNIIKQKDFLIEDKLIVCFEMLLNILESEDFRENSILKNINKYKDKEYIQEIIEMYRGIEQNIDDSIEEINYLFLDIIENYKEVSVLESVLEDIASLAENIEIEELSAKWNDYKILFEENNNLIENCIISKILSSCVSDDIEELTISLQMIIIEYLLVRYAAFLKYCINENKEIKTENIKDYIVAFSRIIGNNTEAVIEFFRDGFGKDVLEIGYLCFITLF